MLTRDVDLLRVEPRVFLDAAGSATELVNVSDGVASGTTLSSASADFEAAGVGEGFVAVVGGEALEVTGRTSATELDVSRPRAEDGAAAIEPDAGSALTVVVRTFARVVHAVEARALASLGLTEADAAGTGDASIVDPKPLARLVAQRSVAAFYEAEAARAPADATLAALAAMHRARAVRLAHGTAVEVDRNGDGEADGARRVDVVTLTPR